MDNQLSNTGTISNPTNVDTNNPQTGGNSNLSTQSNSPIQSSSTANYLNTSSASTTPIPSNNTTVSTFTPSTKITKTSSPHHFNFIYLAVAVVLIIGAVVFLINNLKDRENF